MHHRLGPLLLLASTLTLASCAPVKDRVSSRKAAKPARAPFSGLSSTFIPSVPYEYSHPASNYGAEMQTEQTTASSHPQWVEGGYDNNNYLDINRHSTSTLHATSSSSPPQRQAHDPDYSASPHVLHDETISSSEGDSADLEDEEGIATPGPSHRRRLLAQSKGKSARLYRSRNDIKQRKIAFRKAWDENGLGVHLPPKVLARRVQDFVYPGMNQRNKGRYAKAIIQEELGRKEEGEGEGELEEGEKEEEGGGRKEEERRSKYMRIYRGHRQAISEAYNSLRRFQRLATVEQLALLDCDKYIDDFLQERESGEVRQALRGVSDDELETALDEYFKIRGIPYTLMTIPLDEIAMETAQFTYGDASRVGITAKIMQILRNKRKLSRAETDGIKAERRVVTDAYARWERLFQKNEMAREGKSNDSGDDDTM